MVAFTGAGISAESGIPTYRGAGGVWNKYDPDKYANINYFFRDPSYYWCFFRDVRYGVLKDARPNAGHRALARLEAKVTLKAVITHRYKGSGNRVCQGSDFFNADFYSVSRIQKNRWFSGDPDSAGSA
ncbi:MAG: SIR2 family NAD-dependent protein deacylase [Desulfosalsimonas sp.]